MQATADYVRPHFYPKQAAFLYAPARYSITEASTKSGKTEGCLGWLSEQAALNGAPGRNFWWVAPTFGVAKIAYRRMKRSLPREHYTSREDEQSITLLNGATIWFKGADNTDTLYGEDVFAAVVDEASRCKPEAWYALRSTLTHTRGPIRIIGNVKGRKNWAYKMARQAESGAPDMAYFKLTAYDAVDAGILDAAEIEDAKRTLPDNVFKELYLAEPSDDGGNPFGIGAIQKCIAQLSTDPVAVWGWDLAKSVDWTVGIGLDKQGRTCRFERWQGPWESTITRIKSITGRLPALVDSTGVGDPILEALQKDSPHYEGFKFSAPSKQQIMEGLAVAIQQQAIAYPDGPIVNELEQFEYVYTRSGVHYSAPEGLYDDCVCALALAVAKQGRPVFGPRFSTV
jgi:hypothetical protein